VNYPLATLFERFLKERTYLKNVTPRTLVWYQVAFKNCRKAVGDDVLPTRAALQQFVIHERDRGIRPVTVACPCSSVTRSSTRQRSISTSRRNNLVRIATQTDTPA